MMTQIEGVKVQYKDITDLSDKLRRHLQKVESRRQELWTEYKTHRKKERALRKFLGMRVDHARHANGTEN